MRTMLVTALLLPLVLTAGCGGGAKHATVRYEGPVVPWTSTAPSQFAPRTPASASCRAADLAVHGHVDFEAYGNGGGIAVIALENKGKQACRLEGNPKVRLVKPGGPKQVNTTIARPPLIFPDTAYPLSSLLAVQPGEFVGLTVTWENWCDPEIPGKERTPPSAVRITLPNGAGHVDGNYNAVPPCSDPKSPSKLGVSPFETAKVKGVAPWAGTAVKATIPDQPIHAKAGEILHFTVVLTNISHTPLSFDHCPAFVQQLVPMGQVEVHVLNCAAAKPIAPGKGEAFAMQIRVPENAPVGGNGLFWALDPFGAKQPQISARTLVDPPVKR